jgi:hypothetical protein
MTVDAMNGVVKWNVYKIKQFRYTVIGIYYHSNTHFKEKYINHFSLSPSESTPQKIIYKAVQHCSCLYVKQNFSKQDWPIAIVLNVKYKEIMDDNVHKYYILFSGTT